MASYWWIPVSIGLAAEAAFIALEYHKRFLFALLLKTAASLCFVLFGLMLIGYAVDPGYGRLVLWGLALGAVGDVCLNLRFLAHQHAKQVFLAGIAAFFAGHVCYLIALIGQAPRVLLWAVPACAVLSVFVLRFILKRIEVAGALKAFGIVYIVMVLLMMCCALGLLPLGWDNHGYWAFAVGAALFAASDILLVLGQFGKQKHASFRALNLSLYYIGQLCIALTVYVMR